MKKKCEECKKEYEPPYPTERLRNLSKFCPKCVESMCGKIYKRQAELIREYNYHPDLMKFGYEYVHGWDEFYRLGGIR